MKYNLSNAIKSLESGEVIVYPTDTLYALGADIFNKRAVKKVFIIKKRTLSNPLPVAVFDYETITNIALTNDKIEGIVKKLLPGPYTIILKKKNIVPDIITGNKKNIAIRIPNNKIALQLLSEFGPLTVTSANIHGDDTPSEIFKIKEHLSDYINTYIENGILDGKPSTIIDLTSKKPKILRKGIIPIKQVLDVLNNE